MSGRIGIELTPEALRVVVASPWRDAIIRTAVIPWLPDDPEAAVADLRRECGTPTSVCIAVGLGFLDVARVSVPPAPDEDRERIVALEPDRFFARGDSLLTCIAPGSDVAFAASRPWIEEVRRALSAWAPVERVEPSPLAIVASFGGRGNGTYAVDAGPDDDGLIAYSNNQLVSARRIPRATGADVGGAPLPPIGDAAGSFRAAWGAVLRQDAPTTGTLLGAEARRDARARARRRAATALVAVATALTFVTWTFDRSRDRLLLALEQEAARLTSDAAPVLAAQQRLSLDARERELIETALARRTDHGAALAAISRALPGDAVVLSARATGEQWQIDGTAASAAALVPALDSSAQFDSVRVLAASSRFRDGNRTRETFSIGLHVRPR